MGILVIGIGLVSSQSAHAASYTSVQSGAWNNPATWGLASGFPSDCFNDSATISAGHTVTLDANRCTGSFDIKSTATLDLGAFELRVGGSGVNLINNGILNGTNRLYSLQGAASQTWMGNGTYSGNLKLENENVAWHIAANTSFTFNSAANNVNIQIDTSAQLNVNNPLIIIAPSSGSNYVTLDQQGGQTVGSSLIQTQGNVRLRQTGGDRIHVPVETVSGASRGDGYFGKGWTVDTGASLALSGSLMTVSNLDGGSGLIIASGASLNLAGNTLNIAFNGPFTNNGTVNNTGAFSRIVFMDNGVHAVSGNGLYSGSVGLEVLNNNTNVAAGSSFTFGAPAGNTNIQVDSGANLNFAGGGSLTLSGTVLNNGAINMNGSAGCGAAMKIRSSVTGTQRAWNGNAMTLVGADVRDQAGSATINLSFGLNAGNNGANWNFASACIRSRADFDGDGKTDLSVFRPSEGNWYLNRSSAGLSVIKWGISTDMLVPGDFDGDGKTDTVVFRPDSDPANADFYILNSSGFTFSGVSWGVPGDIPVSGDYDGDGKTDLAVFRPTSGVWYILNSGNLSNTIEPFGLPGDTPLAIDNNGDGKTNLAVFRPGDLKWYIARPTGVPATNFDAYPFGVAGDKPVPADYDGDNKEDIAMFRPSNGTWYILRSSNGSFDFIPFGVSTDFPVPGDYDGDGRDDVAIYRAGTWYINRSTSGLLIGNFGNAADMPIPAKYLP